MNASKHMERVKSLPCVICKFKLGQRKYGCEVHHVGDAEERDDFAVASLCAEHHRGAATGVHGLHRRAFRAFWKVTDVWLLARTNELLAKEKT